MLGYTLALDPPHVVEEAMAWPFELLEHWALTLLMELSLETQLCLPKNWFNDTIDQWNKSGKAGKSDRTFEPIIAKHESYNWIRGLMVTSLTKILHLNPSNKSASRNNQTPTAPPTAPIRCTVYRLDGATSPSNERTSWLCLYHPRTSHSKHQTSGNKLTKHWTPRSKHSKQYANKIHWYAHPIPASLFNNVSHSEALEGKRNMVN